MNRKIKVAASSAMSAAMILSFTGCSEEGQPSSSTYADYLPLEEYIDTVVDEYKTSLAGSSNADITVENKIKYLGWWEIDETQASAVLFKDVYGIPDEAHGSSIFEYTYVDYGERYNKLALLVNNGDSPDIFQFEIINFPYTAVKNLFQPIDDYIDFSNSIWDPNREAMEKFNWNNENYCAITTVNLDELLWYRRSVMEENNITDPYEMYKAGTWDWNAFLEICAKFSDPVNGKYCIEGYHVPDKFISTTGVPIVGINSDGKLECNYYNSDVERCMTTVVDQMFKQDYRYPRHELNGWTTNQSAWVDGNILFWSDLSNAIKDTFQTYFAREGWEAGDVFCVPYPRDPNSDVYYQTMKIDSWMLCAGAQNTAGFAAWNICNMYVAYDSEVARIGDDQMMTNNLGYNQEVLDHLRDLQFNGVFSPVFDFKNGIGQDLADSNTTNNPVDAPLQYPYLDGMDPDDGSAATFTSLREKHIGTIQDRIDKINSGTL